MSHEVLATIWGALLIFLLTGYAILDGFDLGVGILHPFVPKKDHDRRILMNAIGPLWDGNEVWLVTFGGALFAAFPEAYASLFSAFYLPFMCLLFALILRAVSLEFRGKVNSAAWRSVWDGAFFAGSTLATFLFGVAIANTMQGIALSARGDFVGRLVDLLSPFALLVGAFSVATFAMHGAIFLYLKTEGELQQNVKRWIWRTFFLFVALYATVSIVAWVSVPNALRNFEAYPLCWIMPVLNLLAILNIPRALTQGRPGYAFVSSSATIAALVFLIAVALYPNMVHSHPNPEHGLTLIHAASSESTLRLMLVIAALGMPFVLTYTAIIYWTYRGRVRLDDTSY